ncbi:MAG: hypothetical protein EOO36_13450 [Cytophagaceae bacterium]|nr:MAG: hypothetical protein EOO36_13450 [Cytophagaceae bacterium]
MPHPRAARRTLLKGAQGNFPSEPATAWTIRHSASFPEPAVRHVTGTLFDAPFLKDEPNARLSRQLTEEIARAFEALPPGTQARQGTSLLYPPAVLDLIGVRECTYLDHGGLARHRSLGDMMRYIAINQSLDFLASYGGYIPAGQDH